MRDADSYVDYIDDATWQRASGRIARLRWSRDPQPVL